MPGNRGSGYQPADAAGHFVSQPQAPTGTQDVFDFEELETDPSERRPGGSLAKRLWSASPEVRQWKWVSVGLVFVAAFFLQSLSLYFATRRYVRWVGGLTEKAKEHHASHFGDRSQHPQLDMLVLRLLQPRDTVGEMLNVGDGVSKMPFDILLSLLPLFWLAAVVQARNLRLWTRTLLAAAFLALLRGLLSSLTLLPDPLGWQGCEANLRPELMAHYQGQHGFADIAKGTGLVLWLWLQDLVLGMRLQEHLVCAGGASLSGSAFFSALFALAIYDLSRMWTRKMKPHFRSLAHLASGGLLTVLVLVDASIDVALGRQYTAGVTMSLVLALLTYQSPALAVCADRLLVRGTPGLNTLAGQAPPKESHHTEDTSRDLGDIVVPPCCLPFCGFHGRYFLYSQPASEKEQELLAQRQAQAELEQLQKEQESTTRRLLELEAQLESLHARQAERAAEEPKIFEEQLQSRLNQARLAFEQQTAKLQADSEKVQEEKLRLQERVDAEARKEELLSGVARAVEPEEPKDTSSGDFRVLPQSAWEKLHARFGPTGAPAPAMESEPRQAALAAASKEPMLPPKAFSLPPHMRPSATPSLCFQRIAVAVGKPIEEVGAATIAIAGEPSPAAKGLPEMSAADDLEKPALSPTPQSLSVDETATELPKSLRLPPPLRPSATPSLCFRRLPERKGPKAS